MPAAGMDVGSVEKEFKVMCELGFDGSAASQLLTTGCLVMQPLVSSATVEIDSYHAGCLRIGRSAA